MDVICNVCGFNKNEKHNSLCMKCGSELKNIISSSQKNEKRETINIDPLKKRITRIIDPAASGYEESKDLSGDSRLASIISEHVVLKVDKNKKKTLFIGDFDTQKEKNLHFELVPLSDDNAKPLRFYSNKETVKRSNIADDDYSISSEEHVTFEKTEDGWKMKNVSSNGALFIRVEDEYLIQENDIIIIGKYRPFLFKPQK
jgi:hypothetical protein